MSLQRLWGKTVKNSILHAILQSCSVQECAKGCGLSIAPTFPPALSPFPHIHTVCLFCQHTSDLVEKQTTTCPAGTVEETQMQHVSGQTLMVFNQTSIKFYSLTVVHRPIHNNTE